MNSSAAAPRLIPRWVLPRLVPDEDTVSPRPTAARAELSVHVPLRLAARARLLARRAGHGWEAAALAVHAGVLAAVSGERTLVTRFVPPPGEGTRESARPVHVRLSTESDEHGDGPTWRALLASADRAWRSPVEGESEVTLDLAQPYVTRRDFGTRQTPAGAGTSGTVLTTSLRPGPDGLTLRLRYRADVVDAAAAARVAGYYVAALECLVAAPDQPVRTMSLLSGEELRHQVLGMSGRARDLPDKRFHELFEEQAASRPRAVAATHAGRDLTYAELNAHANRVAHAILSRDLGTEAVVAVVTERNLDWLIAVLGVLKAGVAYLPVEPHAPVDRMARTFDRAGCRLALTEDDGPGHLEQAAPSGLELLTVHAALSEVRADDNPGIAVPADGLAYLYFTSGSTGEPKGAMCEHAGFLNHLYAKIEDQGVRAGHTVAQTAPQSFDISLWQLVAALLVGGRTLIVDQEAVLDVDRYLDTIEQGEVAVLQAVPSYLDVVLARLEEAPRKLPALRCVSVTGEALKKELAVRWFARFPRVPLLNAYGLTETSDDTNHAVMTAVPGGDAVPLGPPVRNVTVYVVDEHLRPVPLGAPGEIVFSGVCVGRGYVNDPERTAEAFVRDPHRSGQRLYRSGDFGRWTPEGSLEFLGRRDAQVKIRGFRIEIGEIENQLLRLPGVRDGAVVVVDGTEGDRHLVGFQTGSAESSDALRQQLTATLPKYMVPGRIVGLDALPLTSNGKIDKRALADLAQELDTDGEPGPYEAPSTPPERRLAEAWADVLRVPYDRISRHDDFFDIGGTSLTAVRLVVGLGRAITLRDIQRDPTLAGLARRLENGPDAGEGDAESGTESGTESGIASGTGAGVAAGGVPAAGVPSVPPASGGPDGTAAFEVVCTEGRPAMVSLSAEEAVDPAVWAAENVHRVRATVAERGALLVRGLGLRDAETVGSVARELVQQVMTEREGFAARSQLANGVYSSSEWPADQPMCMHHELSYARETPSTLLFACLTAPEVGGITGVADSTEMLNALPDELVDRFAREGWLLDRSYTETVGVGMAAAFGTEDRAAVEAYCAERGIECRWQPNGDLRTRQRATAVLDHPVTGRRGWFNQIAFLNEWTLDPVIREYLTFEFGSDGLPFNSRYGSGDPLDEETVLAINDTYEKLTLREPWRPGDLLIVDNLRMAHSRESYEGDRQIAVVMGDPVTLPPAPPH